MTRPRPRSIIRAGIRTGIRAVWAVLAALGRLWVIPVVLIVWELATRSLRHPYFPPPTTIALRLRELWFSGPPVRLWLNDAALGNVPHSLSRLLAGWALAGVIGVLLGIALGRSPLLFRFLDPVLQFGRALPPPALLPMFLALFATGARMQIATIACGIVWPVLINAADGARTVDQQHLDTAQVFRLSRRQRLLRVILPSAAPKIFAGLRLSLSLALILMVIAEFFSTEGIGFQLRAAQRAFDLPGMWGVIIVLGVLGYLLNQLFLALERRVLKSREITVINPTKNTSATPLPQER
ncbi:ABC transporter permease [Nonomuraea sp. NN258]|uniref:ABC transporter permease n=1 Tax=Nonomuraea antri TaxID=2730852 RepID=UPI00156A1331|nr:ABC transporter permease [Nonomuraea antri]NRQ38289.1 ABC transporter permease [Nonomuraea antri]